MPLITYTRDIPDANNNPSADQPDMKINNNNIDTIIDVDHFSFNDTNFSGIHKQVRLRDQPAPALGDGTGLMFADNPFPDGFSWPFWRNAGGTELMVGPSLNNANGYILVGAYMVQWGFVNSTTNGTVAFAPAFSAVPYHIATTVYFDSGSATPTTAASVTIDKNAASTTAAQFKWKYTGSGSGTGFYWLAIGLR